MKRFGAGASKSRKIDMQKVEEDAMIMLDPRESQRAEMESIPISGYAVQPESSQREKSELMNITDKISKVEISLISYSTVVNNLSS